MCKISALYVKASRSKVRKMGGRRVGRTDGHHHTIIRPVRRAYKKEVKRTDDHCIFFDLGSDWDFSNFDSVFNTGERSEPEKFDYKKVKTTFGPPLLPIKPPHWTPPLTNLMGVSRPCPSYLCLRRKLVLNSIGTKICGGMLQGTEYC